jgi:hypothetical protein
LRFGAASMNRVLMVAYHFPPLAGSSGIQRTLRFVQQLPRFGWQPLVLSIDVRAYQRTAEDLLADVPRDTVVKRAFGLDAARHLAIGRFYFAGLARPDRWMSWRWSAVRDGMRMIDEFRPQALWSTYPIATAHVIAAELQRRSGLPWIADFRDPMAQPGYPADPKTWKSFDDIEKRVMRQSSLAVFTTPGALRTYAQRYPEAKDKMALLENGYDEDSFAAAVSGPSPDLDDGRITLLHSGIVYPEERDPTQLFAALRQLKRAGRTALRVKFRAPAHFEMLRTLGQQHDVADMVEILPPVPYREALDEMLRADALLVLQASNCNEQIPAKIYEYLRARRPILCLSDPAGDTIGVVRRAGIDASARLDSPSEIAALFERFLDDHQAGRLGSYLPTEAAIVAADRLSRTEELAGHLAAVT